MLSDMPLPQLEYCIKTQRWRLIADYHISGHTIPAGFESDGATVPRFLWWYVPPTGPYLPAVLIHDFLYQHAIGSKAQADKTFYTALQQLPVGRCKSRLMYWGVKIFGRGAY